LISQTNHSLSGTLSQQLEQVFTFITVHKLTMLLFVILQAHCIQRANNIKLHGGTIATHIETL